MLFPEQKPPVEAMVDMLEHHGIKGMKWGVRKEVDAGIGRHKAAQQTSRDKQASKHEAVAKIHQKQIDALKAKPAPRVFKSNRQNQIATLSQARDAHLAAAKALRAGKFTPGEKDALRDTAVVGGLLASYGLYKIGDSGQARQLIEKGAEIATKESHVFKEDKALSGEKSVTSIMKEVVPQINPGYGSFGTKMNCRRCTFSYEMRRRGFDVKATLTHAGTGQTSTSLLNAIDPKSHLPTGRGRLLKEVIKNPEGPIAKIVSKNAWGLNNMELPEEKTQTLRELMDMFNDTSGKSIPTPREKILAKVIFNNLSTQPNGARGELGMGWTMGGGHSMAWEIIDGKPVIFDTQNGKLYSSPAEFEKTAKLIKKAGYTRLDNVDLNQEFLQRWLKDA
jgi:hypothetical protein